MYLKKLESVGFKSFAERISVEFVPGVTAVVGPNGSGKSNITDAIRWVLGEQSAKSLRGSKMEDIIFQGSDTRNPLNVAEVTLTLDNEDKALPLDYEEVSVTRRVYRSGESEFYINKQACRLKDIINLFMDSGLGKEAFSIIGQGKVEEILSSKAEERRAIFEEAAGVLKYKHRKKTSEYKLAETEENLNRVEDILHEIESQLGPLEKQKDTAKQYLELKEKLKEQEISLLITEIESLHTDWQNIQKKIEEEKEKQLALSTTIQKKEASIEKQKHQNENLDEEIEKLQAKLLTSTEQLQRLEGRKQLFTERSKHYGENKQKLQDEKKRLEEQLKTLNEKLEIEKEELATLQKEKEETKQTINKLQKELDRNEATIARQIEELKSDYIEYLNEQAAIRNEIQSIGKQLEQNVYKNKNQTTKYQASIKEREQLERDKEITTDALKEQESLCQRKEEAIKQLKINLTADKNQYDKMQKNLYEGYQYIEKLKSQKEILEEMKEDFQGFFQGVKAVLQAREKGVLKNIKGAVIELIDVPAAYITAIETVLGSQAQHVVVDDEDTARSAITWLKKTNNGRVTFLPLKTIKERFVPKQLIEKIRTHDGFVGVAAEIVQTNPEFIRAVKHLMGHVIIAETLKDANELAHLTGRRYRIVTLDGDVVSPGGSMTGGANKRKNQSLFTREKQLEEISNKLDNYEARAASFSQKVKDEKLKVEEKERELETKEKEITNDKQELQQLRSSLERITYHLDSLNGNLSIYDAEKKQYESDIHDLKQRKEELETKLHHLKGKLEETEETIETLTKEEAEVKENRERVQDEFHEKKLIHAQQEERYRNQLTQVRQLEEEMKEATDSLEENRTQLDDLDQFIDSEETEDSLQQAIEKEKGEKTNLNEIIQAYRHDRSTRTQHISDEERELREENKQNQLLLNRIQEEEVQMNRLDVALENRLHHLQEEYTITFEKAKDLYPKSNDVKQSKQTVEEIKSRMTNLGTVNLGSIDEYERIYERFTFLKTQQEDLVEAKQTLFDVIRELDKEMIDRFSTTFEAIKHEFTIVFKELFGGGKAELNLTDPNNMLETGVEIIAQPPGKKLQYLGLLSGGERALTAIALLFAILRVRPVPFCILDEVEAALDEANVTRFAKYVRQYSKETQFIVITHRKGTMEEADVLYGVTMQESGVSRLVSVKLEETENLVES
jgi:chromosome segregation protein